VIGILDDRKPNLTAPEKEARRKLAIRKVLDGRTQADRTPSGRGMADRNTPERFTQSAVQDRGWTRRMIETLLGPPDDTAEYPHGRSASPVRLFDRARVEAAEATESFRDARAKADCRRAAGRAGAAAKTQRLLARLHTEPVPALPAKTAADLLSEAVAAHERRRRDRPERSDEGHRGRGEFDDQPRTAEERVAEEAAFHARITVNHVRHELTDYEDRLDRLAGRTGVREARALTYELVFGAIADTYPWLAEECERQRREREIRDEWTGRPD
jgi:hypothetical protein